MIKRLLQHPQWTSSPECEIGGIFEHTQLFLSGNTITNLLLDDDEPEHYGIYAMKEGRTQKIPMTFDMSKPETTFDINRLLQTLKTNSKHESISVFLCICSPHTISPHYGSILKWKGRSMPPRKATHKYDSFYMSDDIIKKVKIIQKKRFQVEKEGKERFKKYSQNRRFTRSMSFPPKLRNGSTDHALPLIGKGLNEVSSFEKKRGIYYKIDEQDYKTNEMYEIHLKKIDICSTDSTK